MSFECHRVWCGKQSLALVFPVPHFGVKCEDKVMSLERDEQQYTVFFTTFTSKLLMHRERS